jgi:hypothetical protein
VLGLIRLPPAPFLGAFSVGIARKGPCVNYRPFIEGAHDLWRLGVDQDRSIQALVRVVPVAPAVGEPLPETDARYLPAQLRPEATAGLPSAGSQRALDIAQLLPAASRQIHARSLRNSPVPRCLDLAFAR